MGIDKVSLPKSAANTNTVHDAKITYGLPTKKDTFWDSIFASQSDDKFTQSVYKTAKIAAGFCLSVLGGLMLAAVCKGVFNNVRISKNNAKILNSIPQELKDIFASLKGKEGKEFADTAYSEMVSYLKLDGIAPKTLKIGGSDGLMNVVGGYDMVKNSISFSDSFLKLSKPEQFSCIAHELKHCEQFINMLRLEGMTFEKYSLIIAESGINMALGKEINSNFFLKMQYEKAIAQGKGREFKETLLKQQSEAALVLVKPAFADIANLPKIKPESETGQKILKQIEAYKKYRGIELGIATDEYKNNILEQEAYSFGDKISEFFKKYISVTGN